MLKVFISSTYKDLIEYRKAVIEQLNRMKVQGLKMEYFGATDAEPMTHSLEQLETCNVYLGIIGHRYGSLSPDQERSITKSEYEKALQLYEQGKMRLRIYLADQNVPVPSNLIENDILRAKQQKFRQMLGKHTIKYFQSPHELASWVAADLYDLLLNEGVKEIRDIKIFNKDDWELIKEEFDNAADDRSNKVQTFLHFMAESFGSLFTLDHKRLDVHPFFKRVREQLIPIIPVVALNDEGGILQRTGVRHVILRKETLLLLMKNLRREQLNEIGKEIGKGAASDLIEYTVKRGRFIPVSAEAFVTLWDYWDRTGGWGTLSLIKTSDKSDLELRFQESLSKAEWLIRIDNNFLETESIKETHELCNFWCGYIHGFLNTALRQIEEVMSNLDEESRREVTFPAYHRIVEVLHLEDDNPGQDIFCVRFEKEPYSEVRQLLSEGQRRLKEEDYLASMVLCCNAVILAKEMLNEDTDILLSKTKLPVESMLVIKQMFDKKPPTPKLAKRDTANHWFEAANLFIQQTIGVFYN